MTTAYCQFCVQPIAGTVLHHHGANACTRCYGANVGPLPLGVSMPEASPATVRSDGPFPLPTRQEVRRLVTDHVRARQRAIDAGRNPHQVALDQQDQVQAYAARLPADEAVVFLTMYAEELDASTAQIEFETQAMLAKAAQQESQSAQAGAGLAAVVVFLVFLFAMRGCG